MNFCDYVKRIGLPLVISPVLWLTARESLAVSAGRNPRPVAPVRPRSCPTPQAEAPSNWPTNSTSTLDKFSVVPNGVDRRVRRAGRSRRRFAATSSIGAVPAERGQRRAAKEPARCWPESPGRWDVDLVLLGRVRDRDYLDECLAAGGDRVRHLGTSITPIRCCASAYRACDVFVLPSLLGDARAGGARGGGAGRQAGGHRRRLDARVFRALRRVRRSRQRDELRRAIETAWTAAPDDELAHARVGQLHLAQRRQAPGRCLRAHAAGRGRGRALAMRTLTMLRHLSDRLLYPIAERVAGRQIRAKAACSASSSNAPFAERRAGQPSRLAEQLARAGGDVPYYRDLFRHDFAFSRTSWPATSATCDELAVPDQGHHSRAGHSRCSRERFQPAELHVRKTGRLDRPQHADLLLARRPGLDGRRRIASAWSGPASGRT